MRQQDRRPDLARLQAWLQSAITRPQGAAALDPLDEVEQIVASSPGVPAIERLAIYQHGYRARLLDCFRTDFPCLLHLLGDELFHRFVDDYLDRRPPRSYTLQRLAEEFPDHLAATRPSAADGAAELESWPDLVIDLARLERIVAEVYDGPGIEDEVTLAPEALQELPDEVLSGQCFAFAPCLRLLTFRYPVVDYFMAVRRGEDAPLPSPEVGYVAVHRQAYTARFFALSERQHAVLTALLAGKTVAEATAARGGDDESRPLVTPGEVRDWLLFWADQGFFR